MTVNDLMDLLILMPGDETVLIGLLSSDDGNNTIKGVRHIHDVNVKKLCPMWDEAVIIS